MNNRRLRFDNLKVDTKDICRSSDKYSHTPDISKASKSSQEKDFFNLYLKARSQSGGLKPKNKSLFKEDSLIDKENEVNSSELNNSISNYSKDIVPRRNILKSIEVNRNSPSKATYESPKLVKKNMPIRSSLFKPTEIKQEYSPIILFPEINEMENHEDDDISGHVATVEESDVNQDNNEQEAHANQLQDQILSPNEERLENNIIEVSPNPSVNSNPTIVINMQGEPATQEAAETQLEEATIQSNTTLHKIYQQIFINIGFSFLTYLALLGLDFGLYPGYVLLGLLIAFELYTLFNTIRSIKWRELKKIEQKMQLNSAIELLVLIGFEVGCIVQIAGASLFLPVLLLPAIFTSLFSLYAICYTKQPNYKIINFVFKTLLWLQLTMVGLKVEGVLSWTWSGVFWVAWSFFIITSVYCLGMLTIIIYYLLTQPRNFFRSYQTFGLFWIFLILGGSCSILFCLALGLKNRLDNGDDQFLIAGSLIAGVAHSIFMAILTYFNKMKVKKFINHVIGGESESTEEVRRPLEYKFKKANEELPPYIVMFTPSYFLPFNKSLKIKDNEKIKAFKQKVNTLRNQNQKKYAYVQATSPEPAQALPNTGLMKNTEEISDVKKFELAVNKNAPVMNRPRPNNLHIKNKILNKGAVDSPLFNQNLKQECNSAVPVKEEKVLNSPEIDGQKFCFTENDLEFADQIGYGDLFSDFKTPGLKKQVSLSEKDEEKACLICFDKSPDAVIMSCGHGGVCYECALESWKKSQGCFLCRGKIDKVLHISVKKVGNFNIRKVLSATKLVKEPASAGITTNYFNEV